MPKISKDGMKIFLWVAHSIFNFNKEVSEEAEVWHAVTQDNNFGLVTVYPIHKCVA